MRVVVQRVAEASVSVDSSLVSKIDQGLLILVGVEEEDTLESAEWLANKVANLRIFEDEQGKMNLSVLDVSGSVLAVSQFTLYGDCQKSRRPSFTKAASPNKGKTLYEAFCSYLEDMLPVQKGVFGAHMQVSLINDGPATFIIEK